MQIANETAVSIHYTLTNDAGKQLDNSRGQDPLVYLHGSGQIIPGLENALLGKNVGEKFVVTIPPADAYGEKNDAMLQVVPMTMFEGIDKVEEGMQFHADASHGVDMVTVSKIEGNEVTIDANHPLSGETLTFDIEVLEIRPATKDELSQKHIHGASCDQYPL